MSRLNLLAAIAMKEAPGDPPLLAQAGACAGWSLVGRADNDPSRQSLAGLFACIGALSLAACYDTDLVTAERAWAEVARGSTVLLDVSSQTGRGRPLAVGAVRFAVEDLESSIGRLDRRVRYVLYSTEGESDTDYHRARAAAARLRDGGVSDVALLEGSLDAWQGAGFAISGVSIGRSPVPTESFSHALAAMPLPRPAILMAYRIGSRPALDVVEALRRSDEGKVPYVLVGISEEGVPTLEYGIATDQANTSELALAVAANFDSRLPMNRIVAIGLSASRPPVHVLDPSPERARALRRLLAAAPGTFDPEGFAKALVHKLYSNGTLARLPKDAHVAVLDSFCRTCPGGRLLTAAETTSRATGARWIVLIPGSMRAVTRSAVDGGERLEIHRYDDQDPGITADLALLSIQGIALPLYFAPGSL